jgi:NhaP-type Na+/H+ or K+/H+ antiporter
MEHTAWVIVASGLLVFLAHLFAALFERTRVPDVLPLLFIGLAVGPLGNLVRPESLGRVGTVFTTAALVIMLFEGGLDLNFNTLRRSMAGAVALALSSVVATTLAVGLLAHLGLDWPLLPSLVLGTVTSAMASAVVIPMVGKLRVSAETRAALVVESALSDVVCIVLVLGYLAASKASGMPGPGLLGTMLSSLFMAMVVGTAAALLWSTLLDSVRRLQSSMITTPAFVFVVFGVTDLLGYSGAISALAFGVVLGNADSLQALSDAWRLRYRPLTLAPNEKAFFGEIVFATKTFFFVYVGMSMHLREYDVLAVGAVITVITLLVRAPVVRAAMAPRHLQSDATVAAVMVPRGLASAVLANLVVEAGMPEGPLLRNIAYAVILFSITVTALLAFVVEKGWMTWPYAAIFRRYAVEHRGPDGLSVIPVETGLLPEDDTAGPPAPPLPPSPHDKA